MARFLKSRVKARGAAPGSLIFMGRQKMESTKIRLFQYSEKGTSEKEFDSIDEALKAIDKDRVGWLNIDGIHEVELIKEIGKYFSISPLILENVVNTGQRSRFLEDKDCITVLAKSIFFHAEENKIAVEQISFVLFENLVISFQEKNRRSF